jgi:hypothetical protein
VASGITGGIAAVSCATTTNCVAAGGDGATSVRPDGSLFPLLHLFPSDVPVALTCAPGSLCTALSYGGLATFRSSTWNTAKRIDARPGQLTAVACGSTTFCMAVDDAGRASLWNGTGWAAPVPTGVTSLSAISCAGGFCQAVSVTGQVTTYQGGIWQAAHRIDPDALTGVSCVTAHFCAAVDASKRVLTFNGLTWSKPKTMGVNQQTVRGYVAVSCATASFCVAVSTDGEELFFGDGAAFLFQADTPFVPLTGVACSSPTFCVAVDEQGRVLTYTESAGVPHWSRPRVIDAYRLTGVSCTSSGSCLASDDQGGTVAYVNGAWTPASQDVPLAGDVAAVSCAGTGTCAVINPTEGAVGVAG